MNILVAMSGGVDSSVAAKLLSQAGHSCIGCTMKLYNNENIGIDSAHTCCSLDDISDARAVAMKLGMPYYVFNLKDDFKAKVIDKFVSSYLNAETPNPCIDCNHYLKFDRLFDRADILGCDHVATGHYARIEKTVDGYLLKKALDPSKDQSYVLYRLDQKRLAKTLFPLGELTKSDVRGIAAGFGMVNADKPDSQDICFAPDGDYARIIELNTGKPSEHGDFVDQKGTVLGEHEGIIRYTIGQRRGLKLPMGDRIYVCDIDPVSNRVILGPNEALFKKRVLVKDMNWTLGHAPAATFACCAKIRYRQKEQPATVTPFDDNSILIEFDEPQRAITPGQSAVLYDGDTVLGGGIIKRG